MMLVVMSSSCNISINSFQLTAYTYGNNYELWLSIERPIKKSILKKSISYIMKIPSTQVSLSSKMNQEIEKWITYSFMKVPKINLEHLVVPERSKS